MRIKYLYVFLVPQEKNDEFDIPKDLFYNSKTNQILNFKEFGLKDDKLLFFGFLGSGISIVGVPNLPINNMTFFIILLTSFILTFLVIRRTLYKNSVVVELPLRALDEKRLIRYRKRLLKTNLILMLIVVFAVAIIINLCYQFNSVFFLPILFLVGCLLPLPSFYFWDILTGKALKLIKKNYLPNRKVEEENK